MMRIDLKTKVPLIFYELLYINVAEDDIVKRHSIYHFLRESLRCHLLLMFNRVCVGACVLPRRGQRGRHPLR